jgi:16S rRNA (uracil1498-N3)-methyltransferase
LKKLILNSPPDADGILRLKGKDYHYLVHVRRLGSGKVFAALLPGGEQTEFTVVSVSDGILTAQCTVRRDTVQDHFSSLPPIYLFQALPKGNKMDLIIRQATETGVFRILPFESEYSQVKIDHSRDYDAVGFKGEKIRRWERIIREARQQSGSMVPTALISPSKLEGLLDYWNSLKTQQEQGLGILLHQAPLEKQLSFHDYLSGNPLFVTLAVGPEGGFSSAEVARFLDTGFKPINIADTVLRTETAALYGVAAIRIILSERAAWVPKIRHSHGNE